MGVALRGTGGGGVGSANSLIPPGFYHCHLGEQTLGIPNLVLQVDGAWLKNSLHAGVGWSIDSGSREGVTGESSFGSVCFASSTLHAEAIAVLKALLWARDEQCNSCRILFYAANLVTLLQDTR